MPKELETLFTEALGHHQAGRLQEAEALYRRILAAEPRHADALHLLGRLAHQVGRGDIAVELVGQAISVNPDFAAFHFTLGVALAGLGRLEEAVTAYETASRLAPALAEPHANRGAALAELGRFQAALAAQDAALAANPELPEAHTNRGNALHALDRLEEALTAHEAALRMKPAFPVAHYNRGNALKAMARPEAAVAAYDQALALRPDYAEAHSNRAAALTDLARTREALAACQAAIRIRPDYADAHYNAAFAHFLDGRLSEAWPEYEWRWRGGLKSLVPRGFAQPQWRGEAAAGRTVLLHAEQGLGDTIQFCRYVPLLAERGAKVILEAPRPLLRLLSSLAGIDRLVAAGEPLPPFDLHCPLMSLPGAFGTTLETVPARVPYLHPPPEAVTEWRARIGSGGFRIGVVWQGAVGVSADRGRSAPLAGFAPLARIPGVRLISLQKGEGLDQLRGLPGDMVVETLGSGFDEGPDAFLDTAGAMASLDLVITVDTAVGHLAGALGRPTWLMLQKVPHWVWTLEGEATPWYPGHRLFRQARRGDWDEVFARMAALLRLQAG